VCDTIICKAVVFLLYTGDGLCFTFPFALCAVSSLLGVKKARKSNLLDFKIELLQCSKQGIVSVFAVGSNW